MHEVVFLCSQQNIVKPQPGHFADVRFDVLWVVMAHIGDACPHWFALLYLVLCGILRHI